MQNILSTMTENDVMHIVSNSVMLYHQDNKNRLFDLDYNFRGTLLYMTIHIDSFADEEIIDTFTF